MRSRCSTLGMLVCAVLLLSAQAASAGTVLPQPDAAVLSRSGQASGLGAPLSGPFTSCTAQSQIPPGECSALVALYNSTNGPGWFDSTGWLQTDTPCAWYGVTCGADRVIRLSLVDNLLSGTLPPQLGDLTGLLNLYLERNQLTGSIPPEFGGMTKLEYVTLWGNQLTGSIPAELGNLTNLVYLELYYNQLSGSIPSQFGNLSKLQVLYLDGNQLSGPIPDTLGDLLNLEVLWLRNNQLGGNIPLALGNLTSLYELELGYNALTASDPGLITFLDLRDPDWDETQTVPPTSVQAEILSCTSVQLTWMPIPYTADGGYYQVSYATTPGGPYTVHGTTADKSASSYTASELPAGAAIYWVLRTHTPAHGEQQNSLWSAYSVEQQASSAAQAQIALVSGWNLVSSPLAPACKAPAAILAGLGTNLLSAYAYDPFDAVDPWESYRPGSGGDLTLVDEERGVWVQVSTPVTLTVTGTPPTATDIALKAGWNLVGFPASGARPVATATTGIAGQLTAVYGYDTVSGSWRQYRPSAPSYVNTLAELVPNRGYWIRVTQDCTWSVPY